jgi:hypothetical protein
MEKRFTWRTGESQEDESHRAENDKQRILKSQYRLLKP